MSSLGFVSSTEEWMILLIPWLGIAAGFFSAFFLRIGRQPSLELDLAGIALGLLFLDGIHVIYSFILVCSVPELQTWSQAKTRFGWKLAAVATILAVLFYFLRLSPLTVGTPLAISAFFLIEAFGPSQHTLAQIRGISFCYNSTIRKLNRLSAGESERAMKTERREKLLFQLLLVGDLCTAVPHMNELFMKQHPAAFGALRLFGVAVVCLGAGGILLNALFFPRQEQTNKLLFLSRVILYPIRLNFDFAYVLLRMTHGSEYLAVFRQIVTNSKASASKRRSIFRLTLLATAVYAPIYVLTFQRVLNNAGIPDVPQAFFMSALLFHLVVRYLHYYMDRAMFRMSDASTRAAVAPLLVSQS